MALLSTSSVMVSAQQTDPAPVLPSATVPAVVSPVVPDGVVKRPGVVARLRTWADDVHLVGRLNGNIDGWYPRIGGITRGSGFAFGPGFRTPLLDDALFLDVSGALSMKGYTALDTRLRWLRAFDGRMELWTDLRLEDFPEEDFFGTGMNTLALARTNYDFDSREITTRAVFRPRSWARLTALTGFMWPDIGAGGDPAYPSIEERFTDTQAPGLLDQPRYLHTGFEADIDYRDTPGNTASGGLYRLSMAHWNDVTLDDYDFRRFDAHLLQFVPVTPGRAHVLLGRMGVSYVNNSDGHRVPFYFLPYVGGQDTVRSFHEFRFKDENALWVSGEYKWRAASYLSLSVFADAGEVGANWESLDLARMRTGYGAGIAFHAPGQTILRIDAATGPGAEWQLFVKFRPLF